MPRDPYKLITSLSGEAPPSTLPWDKAGQEQNQRTTLGQGGQSWNGQEGSFREERALGPGAGAPEASLPCCLGPGACAGNWSKDP